MLVSCLSLSKDRSVFKKVCGFFSHFIYYLLHLKYVCPGIKSRAVSWIMSLVFQLSVAIKETNAHVPPPQTLGPAAGSQPTLREGPCPAWWFGARNS